MGSRQDVVELQEGMVERGWLLLPHVKHSPCDDAVLECLLQRDLVVEIPTGCIQEDGRGLHHRVLTLAYHPARLIRQRDMQRHEIGLFQQPRPKTDIQAVSLCGLWKDRLTASSGSCSIGIDKGIRFFGLNSDDKERMRFKMDAGEEAGIHGETLFQ